MIVPLASGIYGCGSPKRIPNYGELFDPNQHLARLVYIIELLEMYEENDKLKSDRLIDRYAFHSLRVYFGEYGSLLTNFKEIKDIDIPEVNYFETVWTGDEQVTIRVMRRDETDESFFNKTYRFDFLTETPEKLAY